MTTQPNHSHDNSHRKNHNADANIHTETISDAPVLFTTYTTNDGHLIGEMMLNSPKSLNALSVDMCKLMGEQLNTWQDDDRIVAIMLRGAGDKAFCAGGDIRKLYDSMIDNPPMPNPYASEFFGNEYTLYRQMHFYHKPIVLWGNGIVMGGGMGLMAACSHRIVTETTKFAMPEITIGLFPDATGSWFLQRMPAKIGLFLGLTGAMGNANDAQFVGLAEYALPSDSYQQVIDALTLANWKQVQLSGGNDTASDDNSFDDNTSNNNAAQPIQAVKTNINPNAIVSHSLGLLSQKTSTDIESYVLKPSKLAQYWQPIAAIMNSGGLEDIDAILQDDTKIAAIDSDFAADKWTQRAVATYRHGAPISAALTYEIFHRVKDLSLEQILYMETNVAIHCANNPDFAEGVRALLIDKDKTPKWSRTLEACLSPDGAAYVASHFLNPYPNNEHIFKDWLSTDALGITLVK